MIILATSMNHKYAYSDFLFVVKGRINNLGVIFRDFGGNGTLVLVITAN